MATNIRSLPIAGLLIQNGNGIPNHLSPKGTIFIDIDVPCEYLSNGNGTWLNLSVSSGGTTGSTSGYTLTANQYAAITGSSTPSSTNVFATINDLSSFSGGSDTRITGFTYNNANYLSIINSTGGTLTTVINTMTGLTVNGIFSATTISGGTYYGNGSNLTGLISQDTYVTGGTYSAGIAVFINNTGGTFNVSGFYTGYTAPVDVYVTGGTYDNNTGISMFTNNTGGTFTVTGFNTGTTVNAYSGTTNRITVTGNVINIAPTYTGQTSITNLGTISAGTWNGTVISPVFGGTGVANASGSTLTIGAATSISGGGTIALAGRSITAAVSGNLMCGTTAASNRIPFGAGTFGNTLTDSAQLTYTLASGLLSNTLSLNGNVITDTVNNNAGTSATALYRASNGSFSTTMTQYGNNVGNNGLVTGATSAFAYSGPIGMVFINNNVSNTTYFKWGIGGSALSNEVMKLETVGLTLNSLTGVTTQMVVANTSGRLSVQAIPTFSDTFVTGFTYNNANTLSIINNTGGTLSTNINTMTGLTVNGGLTANTYTVNGVIGLSATTAQTIDLSISDHFSYTLSGNTIFTFNNNSNGKAWLVGVNTNPVTSGYTSSFTATTANVKWPYSITPVQTPTSNKTDIYSFVQINGVIYGDYSQQY